VSRMGRWRSQGRKLQLPLRRSGQLGRSSHQRGSENRVALIMPPLATARLARKGPGRDTWRPCFLNLNLLNLNLNLNLNLLRHCDSESHILGESVSVESECV